MKIAIGSDHRGFECKAYIKQYVVGSEDPVVWIDVGADNDERSDFPVFTKKVCDLVTAGEVQYGILLCGSGIGMSIAANRYKTIYGALVWNEQVAALSKEHNNANVLILPADFISLEEAGSIVNSWLNATFQEGRYQQRIDMIDTLS